MISATFSPDDNKIRLYATSRLDAETYARVKAAGFSWAPRQELFVAPMWTPEREDLALELSGQESLDDEDTSLVERAEERSERFEEYSEKRAHDAERTEAAVDAIAVGIPLGQPILVGHHSERRARKDAERIRNGTSKAIKLWETSDYWTRRAAGAISAAKYKERADVRHRRIKGLESDKRKQTKEREVRMISIRGWGSETLTREKALKLANLSSLAPWGTWSDLDSNKITLEQAKEQALKWAHDGAARCERWLKHIENRLAYERAMLGEQGGAPTERFDIEVGGRITYARFGRVRRAIVFRLNKGAEGRINSVSVGRRMTVNVEEISAYEPPAEGDLEKVKAATKLPPLVNYPGEGFMHMTKSEYQRRAQAQYASTRFVDSSETHGAYRIRNSIRGGGNFCTSDVYVTDMPTREIPAPVSTPAAEPTREVVSVISRRVVTEREPSRAEQLRERLKAGVKVVVNPDLFPTPPDLAQRMVEIADVAGRTVLEPSAGTGALVDACAKAGANVHALERDYECRKALSLAARCIVLTTGPSAAESDFEAFDCFTPCYERIVANPPFGERRDVKHLLKAYERCLSPGGRMVAIVSAGIKYRTDAETIALRSIVERHGRIEDLPEGTFAPQSNVRTCLIVVDKPLGTLAATQCDLFAQGAS